VVKHRKRMEIVADVLRATGRGARKTRIMYNANLSSRVFKKYLEESVNIGFLSFNDAFYQVTESGELFLKKYVDFSNRYSKVGKELQSVALEGAALERMCTSNLELERTPHKTASHAPPEMPLGRSTETSSL
jgi:predicted transcriptional regulator